MAHRLAPLATADLDDIWLHIVREGGSEAIADNQVDAITDRFYLLSEHPRIGRARDGDLGPGTRSFAVGDYVIVYDIDSDDTVQILRVVHSRRDIRALFGERDG